MALKISTIKKRSTFIFVKEKGRFVRSNSFNVQMLKDTSLQDMIKVGYTATKRLGNAVDPFSTLENYSPDATRWYMIWNANPWDNLKFDVKGIEEVRRKFFGTLYNTYGFFSLYANVDGFVFAEEEIPYHQRPELDRWILSELNTLIEKVTRFYEDYEPTKVARAIQNFVIDDLSNWYVRLSRRRFWKGQMGPDKISAYQTLYQALNT